ncbi:unnamed protein product [Rhizophagus irregularis]|nr:unnamed protein product [Rhizophagus irregularis]
MRVFSTSDLEADFRDPDELSRWLAIKSEVLSKVVEEEETMERISRTGLILSEMLFRVLSSLEINELMKSGLFIGQKLTVSEVRKRQHFVYSSNHMNTNVKKEYGLMVHQRFKDLHK